MSDRKSFRSDERGAVALEVPFVYGFLFLIILLPIADLAVASFQFIAAYEVMRNAGQYMQYHPPSDVTAWSSWVTSLPSTVTTDGDYTISNIKVYCGDTSAVCSSSNTVSPKYYSLTTSFTLTPMVLRSVLCLNTACSFEVSYSERFQ